MSVEDVFHVLRSEAYELQAKDEAAFFDLPRKLNMDVESPVRDSYQNECFTGDSKVAWFETIPSYGTFRRGCALGAGGLKQRKRILEKNPELHLTILDISAESLAVLQRELGDQFPGRFDTETVDLNFIDMPEDTYDLVISSGCVHHLYNLEHIAFQINKSLTHEGYFFLVDYVGEARFQFSEEKKQLFERTFRAIQRRQPQLRHWRVAWPDINDWNYSPFEALRADETLELFRRYLSEVDLRTMGAMFELYLFVKPPGPLGKPQSSADVLRRRLAYVKRLLLRRQESRSATYMRLLSELVRVDREVAKSGSLLPASAFAVYKRRG